MNATICEKLIANDKDQHENQVVNQATKILPIKLLQLLIHWFNQISNKIDVRIPTEDRLSFFLVLFFLSHCLLNLESFILPTN